MKEAITIGVDLAKNVFQVHSVDAAGAVVVRRQLRRGQGVPLFPEDPPRPGGMGEGAASPHRGRGDTAPGAEGQMEAPR